MANSNSNRTLVPEAKDSLNQFKYEVATEVGVNLKDGYNGDISAKEFYADFDWFKFHVFGHEWVNKQK